MKKIIFVLVVLLSQFCFAGWSVNLGFGNPPVTNHGLNLMNIWSDWALEFGLGVIQAPVSSVSSALCADLNFKYLFGTSFFRPYLQAGLEVFTLNGSTVASSPFAGAGFFLMGNKLYFYLSYLLGANMQWGIGFNF